MFKNLQNIASFTSYNLKTNICLFSIKLPILVKISAIVIEILTFNIWCSKVYRFEKRIRLRSMKLTLTSASTAHRVRETVEMLRRETPNFVSYVQWPPNSPDFNPVDYAIWDKLQVRVYHMQIRDVDHLVERLMQK